MPYDWARRRAAARGRRRRATESVAPCVDDAFVRGGRRVPGVDRGRSGVAGRCRRGARVLGLADQIRAVGPMTALLVVQARMGSSRLPGKVLEPLADKPMLAFMLERLGATDAGPVVLATSRRARRPGRHARRGVRGARRAGFRDRRLEPVRARTRRVPERMRGAPHRRQPAFGSRRDRRHARTARPARRSRTRRTRCSAPFPTGSMSRWSTRVRCAKP